MGYKTGTLPGGVWIRQARLRAGLSQTDLAKKLETSQSLVARWERGAVEPGFATVLRAVRACGLDLAIHIVEYDADHDTALAETLRLSPTERLHRMQAIRRQFEKLRPGDLTDARS